MALSPPSAEQIELAAQLNIDVALDTYDVAAARLLDAVSVAIGFEPLQQSSERQRTFASSLGVDVAADSKRVASARIGDALFERNQVAIAALNLKPGDCVIRTEYFEIEGELRSIAHEYVVSSIQPNGRVYFKGGNGQGAWPTQLTKRVI
jgi:hypothetical protein